MKHWAPLLLLFCASLANSADWQSSLGGMSTEAKQLIQSLCTESAKDAVYSTINDVRSISIKAEDEFSKTDISISSGSSGLSYSPPQYQYLRLGIFEIELDGRRFSPHPNNPNNFPIAKFKQDGSDYSVVPSFIPKGMATVEVRYRSRTTREEEKLGVYGREITIFDTKTQEVLGERVEYFWLSGGGFRNVVRHKKALCPSLTKQVEFSPSSFVGRVINPKTYPCMNTYIDASTNVYAEYQKQLTPEVMRDMTKFNLVASENKRTNDKLFSELSLCQKEYYKARQ